MSRPSSPSSSEEDALLTPGSPTSSALSDHGHPPKKEVRFGDRAALSTLLIGLGLFVGATWWVFLIENWSKLGSLKWFSGHPTGQSAGIALVVLAIGQLQPTASPASKAKGLKLHQSLILLAALPSLAFGSTAMYYNKSSHGAAHFTTWHAWFGLGTFSVILLQIAFGIVSVTPALAGVLGGTTKAKKWWKYHRALGYVLVASLLFTAHLGGAHSTWALGASSTTARVLSYWVGLPLIAVGLYARLRPSKLGL